VPHVGIQRGVQNALLGDLTRQDQPRRIEPAEQVVQRTGVERAMPYFQQPEAVSVWRYRCYQVRPLSV
jgi:hypothetical protein